MHRVNDHAWPHKIVRSRDLAHTKTSSTEDINEPKNDDWKKTRRGTLRTEQTSDYLFDGGEAVELR
jgi:hypothetical protein